MQAYDDLQNRIQLLLDDSAQFGISNRVEHEQSVLNAEKRQKVDHLATAFFSWNEADVLFTQLNDLESMDSFKSDVALETYRNFYDR